jgi:nucleolar protein 58
MAKIVSDNLIYTKVVKAVGMRSKAVDTDLSGILPEDIEKDVKDASEISMGTEISETD